MPMRLPDAFNPRRSLRARSAWVLGSSGVAFALLLALSIESYQRAQLVESIGQAMRREALLLSRSLNLALQDQLQQLRQTASQTVLATGLMEPGDARLLLEAVRTQNPALAWLALTDAQGVVQVATNGLFERQALDDATWAAESLKGPWIGDRRAAGRLAQHLGLDSSGEAPALIDLGTPLIDYQGRTRGALVARLRWDWLDAMHRSMLTPDRRASGSDTLVLDRQGRVLLGPPARLGLPLQVPGLAVGAGEAAPRLVRWPGEGEFVTAQGRDDSPASTGPAVSAGLTVLVRQAAAQAFAEVDRLRQGLLLAGLAATAAFVGLSIWLAGRIARPVQALQGAAARISRGEEPAFAKVSARRDDEVASLERSLHALHGELQRRLAEQQRAIERFESLLHNAPVAIYVAEQERLQLANRACLALFGADDEAQLRGKSPFELFHPDDHEVLRQRIEGLARWRPGEPPLHIDEHRIVRLDGRSRIVSSTAIPVRTGDTLGVQVALVDVTDEREARELLREREAQLARTSRTAHVGGWMYDLRTQQAHWTDEMARIYEVPPETVPTQELALSYFRGDDRARLEAAVGRAVRLGEPYDLELPLHMPDGRRKWVRAQAFAQRHEGRTVRLEGITQDITERRAAEEAVRELNARLEQRVAERTAQLRAANAELDSFDYAVSHDLRAPLRAMSGFSQALIEDCAPQLDDTGRGYLDQIVLASKQMGELIDGLLALSRSTRGELRRDEVDLSELATRVVAELRRTDPARKVSVSISPDMRATGDRRMIDIVWRNLIGNAWKYTGHQADPVITVAPRDMDGERGFEVSDNGAGFDMAHAGRLFKAFARLHRQDEFPGLGIGLATVQRIIHRHGGRIEAEGRPGQGARFRFTLPDRGLTEDHEDIARP